jgi:glycosyltransferase involved in cell wall biosynthesis
VSLKILHIIPTLEKGGAEHLVIDICNELQKRKDVEVRLIVFRDLNNYKFITSNIDIHICPSRVIPSIKGKQIIETNNLTKAIKEFKPDIIHSHLFEAEIISRENVFPGIKYFTHIHDNIEQFQNFNLNTLFNKRKLTNFYEKRRLIKKYFGCNNSFIAISKDAYQYTCETLPKKLNKIFLLHNAIDINRFEQNVKLILKQSANNNIKNLVTIGSLVDKKNQIFLINVIKYLKDHGYNVTLDILGAGPNYDLIKNKIYSEHLENFIFLRGKVDNVEEFLQKSYLYLHAATYEPFGLVLIEAMATGLPCVCLDGKGNRDIINEGENGFMIFKQDHIKFSEKIIELIKNDNLYSAMSSNAIETAKKFDMVNYADKLLDIYNSKFK